MSNMPFTVYLAMCVSPIFVSKPSLNPSFIKRVYDARLSTEYKSVVNKYIRSNIVVPCGKCVECLRAKQNDLAVRCVREANRSGNMVFVTLTYDEQHLPIAATTQLVDKCTGEVSNNEIPLRNDNFREEVVSLPISRKPRYFDVLDEDYSKDNALNIRFTPTLDRREFRLYLKRKRMEFLRDNNELGPFKYVAVGEYGPKGCRPHYHIAFFGLPLEIVEKLFEEWNNEIGDVRCSQVKCINDDGSYGYNIASKYIGKYMCKGKVECESVLKGYAEKPRVCISHDLGTFLSDKDLSYYLAFDLFGKYSIKDLSRFSESQLNILLREVNSRQKFNLGGFYYSLPKNLKKRIFFYKTKVYDENSKSFKVVFEASQLQKLRADILQDKFVDNLCRELRQTSSQDLSEIFALAVRKYQVRKEIDLQVRESFKEKTFYDFYSQSRF